MIKTDWQVRRGEEYKQRRNDHRTPYAKDRARILHSAAFRRLQTKTQIMGVGNNDFYRTRLTHSLEVAQIGSGIVGHLQANHPEHHSLLPCNSLIESLCLAHDIGHPPFGHGGEIALNYMMREHGGFEGNAQTFRILAKLEPYTKTHGMNLSRRTLLGVIKYPNLLSHLHCEQPAPKVERFRQLRASDWHPPKGLFDDDKSLLSWVLEPISTEDKKLFTSINQATNKHEHHSSQFKSLDCSIMELADDIAYGVHDLEDAIVMGLISRKLWQEEVTSKIVDIKPCWLTDEMTEISDKLFSEEHHLQKDAIGALVNGFVTAIHLIKQPTFSEPLLAYKAVMEPEMRQALELFKHFVMRYVIQTPEIEQLRYRGQQIVMELFETFASDPKRLLPHTTAQRWQDAVAGGHSGHRVLCDYIAGMTDGYASRISQAMFG